MEKGGEGKKRKHAENGKIENKIEKKSPKKQMASPVPEALTSVAPVPNTSTVVATVSNTSTNVAPVSNISTSISPVSVNGTEGSAQGNTEEKGDKEKIAGFIFMCNGTTKQECYTYRVFGLPGGKSDTVKNIKEGTKLFLFDTDVKLLYGIYKATCSGGYRLEPAAFGGRFPAQVRFKILSDFLPLPESEFRLAIQDNYERSKFKPELSNKQVKKLINMFKPITLPPSGQLPHPVPNVALPQAKPPPVMGEGLKHPPRVLPQPTASSHIAHATPSPEVRYTTPSQAYYKEPRQPYMVDNSAMAARDPYGRYREVPTQMVQGDRLISRASEYHRSLAQQHMDRADDHYNQRPAQAASHVRQPLPAYTAAPSYSSPAYVAAPSSYVPPAYTAAPSSYAPPAYSSTPSYAPQAYSSAPSYAPPAYSSAPSYAPPASHTPVGYAPEYASYQATGYGPTTAYENPNQVYKDPHQTPASVWVSLASEENAPVSSVYSFPGPTPTYR